MNKLSIAILTLSVGFVSFMGTAFAEVDATAAAAATGGAVTLKDTLINVGTTVLPYAAAVLAIGFGWRMVRKFVHA